MHQELYEKYRHYKPEDFLLDSSFQHWIQGEPGTFWSEFVRLYPEKQAEIQEAIELHKNFYQKEKPLSEAYKARQLQAIYHRIDHRKSAEVRPLYRVPAVRYAAAVVLLMLAALTYFYVGTTSYQEYQTAYRETRNFQLADGTEVILNANSQLKAFGEVEDGQPREVWLTGEAFFKVRKIDSTDVSSRFVVHVPNLDVQVLGTYFNVKSRDGNTQVLLEEGAVEVASTATQEKLLMVPGEIAELNSEDQKIRKRLKKDDAELAWRENVFHFQNTLLAEVADQVSNYYGMEVQFSNEKMKEYVFTARVHRDNLPLLRSLIEAAFGLQIKSDKNVILISPDARAQE
jgi:ferric-dicitrate binding protein FerR (iron transport regulator)